MAGSNLRGATVFGLAATLVACQPIATLRSAPGANLGLKPVPPGVSVGTTADRAVPPGSKDTIFTLRGRAIFPATRTVQAIPANVVNNAVVALIDTSGNTIVGGHTNNTGAFTLQPDGSLPDTDGANYYLEVSARLGTGGNRVSMATVVQWTSPAVHPGPAHNGWSSITNGTPGLGDIVVNPTTTAVTLMLSNLSNPPLGSVSGAPSYATPSGFGTFSSGDVTNRAGEVASLLGLNEDPMGDNVADVPLGILAPGDPNRSADQIHDYVIADDNVNSSTFVWIPTFKAYQLMQPQNCGAGNSSFPVGYWVGSRPLSGIEGQDWQRVWFGGFYAAKYPASHRPATPTDEGVRDNNNQLKVAAGVPPWTMRSQGGTTWAFGNNTAADVYMICAAYRPPNSHLMTAFEWTSLAVYAQINNVTVHGNTAELPGINGPQSSGQPVLEDIHNDGSATVSYAIDPTFHDNTSGTDTLSGLSSSHLMGTNDLGIGRALTGSATCSAWSGNVNRSTHTGLTNGVYDLVGNVEEMVDAPPRNAWNSWQRDGGLTVDWTPAGSAGTIGPLHFFSWFWPHGWQFGYGRITGLQTDPWLRSFGEPATAIDATGAPNAATAAWGNASYWVHYNAGPCLAGYSNGSNVSYRGLELRGGNFQSGNDASLWSVYQPSDCGGYGTDGNWDARVGFRPALSY